MFILVFTLISGVIGFFFLNPPVHLEDLEYGGGVGLEGAISSAIAFAIIGFIISVLIAAKQGWI